MRSAEQIASELRALIPTAVADLDDSVILLIGYPAFVELMTEAALLIENPLEPV